MKYVAIPVNEIRSNRFETFLEALGEDENPAGRMVVWGHLCNWYTRWGSDPEYDHGVLWNITDKRLGIWAEWPNPLKFGRALHRAGYVARLDDIYKERNEEGFVVLNGDGGVALEVSWDGWHRKSPIRYKLAHYLTDPDRRERWLAQLEQEGSAAAVTSDGGPMSPPGTSTGDTDSDGQGTSPAGRGNTEQYDRGGGSGNFPERFRKDSGASPASLREVPGKTSKDVKDVKDVKEDSNESTSDVPWRGAVNNSPGSSRKRTAKPKTSGQRDFIREQKYDDTMSCLLALDDTDDAVKLWRESCAKDMPFVQELLANITETDNAWAALQSPCAVVTKKLIGRMQKLRRGRGR